MSSEWRGGDYVEEEGELVESGGETSDDDYSPGSLVIDAKDEDASSNSLSSAPPTPPISRIQSTLEYDTHPIFPSTGPAHNTTVATPLSVAPQPFATLHQVNTDATAMLDDDDDVITTLSSLAASEQGAGSSQRHQHKQLQRTIKTETVSMDGVLNSVQVPPSATPPSGSDGIAMETSSAGGDGRVVVSFVTKMDIASEGSAPIDVIFVYHYHWGSATIDVLTRNNKATLIPIKNVYNRAIPGLKQNVLSARISKLGIRSLVLPEPYVSCLKKLNMGLTGSSHYITINDFIKICTYFKHPPPEDIIRFTLVTSTVPTSDVLLLFNNPKVAASVKLLTRLTKESEMKGSQENLASSGGPGGSRGGHSFDGKGASGKGRGERGTPSKGGEVDESYINSGEIDARMFTLPNGSPIYVFVREGLVYIPNPELAKILPAVSRTAMENIRNSYGITVYQASKAEITFLKYFGVVSPKAGRTLVYKMSDVAKMYQHWNIAIPDFVKEICDGKIPDDKVEVSSLGLGSSSGGGAGGVVPFSPSSSSPRWTPGSTSSDDVIARPSSSATPPGPGGSSKSRHHSQRMSDLTSVTSTAPQQQGFPGHGKLLTFGSTMDESYEAMDIKIKQEHQKRFSGLSPVISSANLTPERFQQPVMMLNSLQQQGHMRISSATNTVSSLGHVIGPESAAAGNPMLSSAWMGSGHVTSAANDVAGGTRGAGGGGGGAGMVGVVNQQMMSPYGAKLEPFGKTGDEKRRRSSSTSGPPLDDQDLDYSSLLWGDEVLTLLCPPAGEEPHLALPELIQKVYRFRSFVSVQRRSRLGVTIIPASSLQIHALRARGSLDSTPGNTKLVTLSDAVKLAVDGNLQIPGSIILTLKKYYKDNIDSILNPTYLPDPPPLSLPPDGDTDEGNSNGPPMATGRREIPFAPPPHPDIINCGPAFRTVEGVMCLVKWGSDKLVVYTTNKGIHYMGLYQVYETLFRKYVTRMNFKVRMRKHDIRSIRAPSDVRVKLIDLNALPPHCPVCGLIRVPEMETLAKSYGLTPPNVFYDVFKAGEAVSPVASMSSSSSKKAGRPKKGDKSRSKGSSSGGGGGGGNKTTVHRQQFVAPGGGQSSYAAAPPVYGHHGDRTMMNAATFGAGVGVVSGQSSSYGIVPYLTSGKDKLGSSTMTSPGVTMTSSAPVSTDQITLGIGSDSDSLIVSIPRNLTPYKVATPTKISGFNPLLTANGSMPYAQSNQQRPVVLYGGSRSRVLQNLAKKITQKSRKFTTSLNSGGQLRNSLDDPSSNAREYGSNNFRVCPSCNQMSPSVKKSCQFCGEFLVGKTCQNCGALNHNRIKECAKCLAPMKNLESPKDSMVGGASDTSSSHPTSPLSPKFSAPPIRSAALKTMFPQSSDVSTGSSVSVGNHHQQQQLMTKTIFSGNVASTRKCQECGQLNTKMAKKCLQCKSHLQGRPCHRCGRPNLNHVTECYKCGATLAPTANKWIYVGSHSGRAYKRPQDPEQELLQSRAPINCVRCHKLRTNNHFKCGRCGDLFRCRAVVLQPWQEGEEQGEGLQPPAKKRKESRENQNQEEPAPVDPAVVIQFAHNLLSLEIADQLSSILTQTEEQTRETIPAMEQDWEDVEAKYQAFLAKKEETEKSYQDTQAELDGLMREVESVNNQLTVVLADEALANELVKSLPEEIKLLEVKIESASKLLFSES